MLAVEEAAGTSVADGVMPRSVRVAPGGFVDQVLSRSVGRMHMFHERARTVGGPVLGEPERNPATLTIQKTNAFTSDSIPATIQDSAVVRSSFC
jgi:hypothetical protein